MRKLEALGIRRAHLLRELEVVTSEIRRLAVPAINEGEGKRNVSRVTYVTRPTLDKWLSQDSGRSARPRRTTRAR